MTTSAAPRSITIEHVVIASNQPYDKVLEGLQSRLGSEEGRRKTEQRLQELTESESERVRLHPYYTDRVLARPQPLASLASIAALHHERLDGSGYYRGIPAALLSISARVLAAADVYHAMIERRPYRPAHTPEAAAKHLRDEAGADRLDGEGVNVVLAAAGHTTPSARRVWPASLSDREVEVLRLLARGHTNREMAKLLSVAEKTVGHHIQHIYNKIAVSTRAAATLFALQHDHLNERDTSTQ